MTPITPWKSNPIREKSEKKVEKGSPARRFLKGSLKRSIYEGVKERKDEKMIYRSATCYCEEGRLYRSSFEIRRDILEIKAKIRRINSMVNIRGLVVELLAECEGSEPEAWIPRLKEIVDDADESLSELGELCERLTELREELSDTLWALGR